MQISPHKMPRTSRGSLSRQSHIRIISFVGFQLVKPFRQKPRERPHGTIVTLRITPQIDTIPHLRPNSSGNRRCYQNARQTADRRCNYSSLRLFIHIYPPRTSELSDASRDSRGKTDRPYRSTSLSRLPPEPPASPTTHAHTSAS